MIMSMHSVATATAAARKRRSAVGSIASPIAGKVQIAKNAASALR
jgi:hypothetical protein